MYEIKDRFYFSMKIDGRLVPLDAVNFNSLTMQSSIRFGFPTAQIVLSDSVRYFDTFPLTDGSTVEIVSGVNYSKPNKSVYKFRIFKVLHQETGHVVNYKIICIFNAPKYINENFKGAYSDTSSNVIKYIAEECGLTPEVDTTTDNQVWYGLAQKRHKFASTISKHSYLNINSCFGLGLTLNSALRLKNIAAINISNTRNLFVQGNKISENVISVLDKKEVTDSGLLNNSAGYKYEALEQSTDSSITHDTINLSLKSTTVNINKIINEKLTGSALEIFPVSSGNTHSNYYAAKYQNVRIKSTYGNSLFLMTNEESSLDLFDPLKYVVFDNINGEIKLNSKLSGGYIVTGKAIHITPAYYYEKFKVTRQGYNLSTINDQDKKILGIK